MNKEKIPKATHQGEVDIAGFKIKCYNLDTGERVLSREGFLRTLGRTGNPKHKEEGDNDLFQTPVFLKANNLKDFISNDLIASSQPIIFEMIGGQKAYGYKADILPQVCYVYIDAEKAGALNARQNIYAERSHILIRGFATVGIIALVDEATGYQYQREKDELQKILKAYIAEELLPWQKTFPDIYYREIFRLNGWDFTVPNIKKRPGVVGTWTNKIIYEQLPKGVLKELKNNTPKSHSGNYTARFFQSLTPDVGNPHLQNQLNSVITLMQVSDNWKHFIQQFNKLVDRRKGQLELKFEDFEEKPETKKIDKPTAFDTLLKGMLSVPPPPKKGK
ncbi:MAG TPA: P63C domain-containing protein [Mucilaginibacter sp.]|jgi:hypothetical protein|nr:P63C domain-containing protein [Mucilaginibacter sp.]